MFVDLIADFDFIPISNLTDTTKMLVYALYNMSTGKSYIGKTKHNWIIRKKTYDRDIINPKRQSLIIRSLRKHGWDAFKIAIIKEGVATLEELGQLEKHYIKAYQTNVTGIGYNMTTGGDGGCSITARLSNQKRMQNHVLNKTFILQRADIKKKANKAASKRNSELFKDGKSNLLWPEVLIKRRISSLKAHSHPCVISVIEPNGIVTSRQYNTKKEAIQDGFPYSIFQHLYRLPEYKINYNPASKITKYKQGDVISIKLVF